MKKILTGIGNHFLNEKLRQNQEYDVLCEDFENDEKLLEYLECGEIVDILFLSSNIVKNYDLQEFVKLVQKIQDTMQVVVFGERNKVEKIVENHNLKVYDAMDLDMELLKQILSEKVEKSSLKSRAKTIAISGASGVGKSTFSTFFAKNVENEKNKTLLINFDLEENHIRTILKIRKTPKIQESIEDLIINVDKNLDVLCNLDSVFKDKSEVTFFKIQEILEPFKENYDLIIIDTSAKLEEDYTKKVFYNVDEIIFLLEPNILGIKKAKNMMEVFERDWNIPTYKIKIILNKAGMYQITDSIIEELFDDIKLIGKMKYNDVYNLMINRNVNKKEIKKEYKKISKVIL